MRVQPGDDRAHGVTATPVRADLATAEGVAALHTPLPRTPDAAALNAGVGQGGACSPASCPTRSRR